MGGVGPGLGAIIATGLYTMLKVLNYDDVDESPDRDDTHIREETRKAKQRTVYLKEPPIQSVDKIGNTFTTETRGLVDDSNIKMV